MSLSLAKDSTFHGTIFDNSWAYWESFFDIRNLSLGKTSLNIVLLLTLLNFLSQFRLKLMYIYHIGNTRLS